MQRHQNGRNRSQRISDQEVEMISAHVLAYKRFMELAERFASLTEQLTWDKQGEVVKKVPPLLEGYLPQTAAFLSQLWTHGLRYGGGILTCRERAYSFIDLPPFTVT